MTRPQGELPEARLPVERMCALARQDVLMLNDLPDELQEQETGVPAVLGGARMESLKRSAILEALQQFGGNRTKAAEFLGISVRTLQRKLRQWEA